MISSGCRHLPPSFYMMRSRHDRTRWHARHNRLDRFRFSRKIRENGGLSKGAQEETNGRNITFQNRSGHHEKSYPDLISKVNLSRGLIKTEDQTWGPCSRTICLCCPPASVAIVRPVYPRSERSFGPTGVDTFHVIATSLNPLHKHCIVFRAGDAPIISYFVINIF